VIASALRSRFSSHLVSFVDIQFSLSTFLSCVHASPIITSVMCSRYDISSRSRSSRRRSLISFAQSCPNSRCL